jgi:starch synthase
MRVVMLSPEAYPYAKTGGLADVIAALPPALARAGVDVTVCVPGFRSALRAAGPISGGLRLHAPVGSRMEPADIVRVPNAAVPTILVRADRYFDREGLYQVRGMGHPDNAERFAFFSRAVLEVARALDFRPEVIHCHDWQTGLVPAYLHSTFYQKQGEYA